MCLKVGALKQIAWDVYIKLMCFGIGKGLALVLWLCPSIKSYKLHTPSAKIKI